LKNTDVAPVRGYYIATYPINFFITGTIDNEEGRKERKGRCLASYHHLVNVHGVILHEID
jgi:hypothetical protein